MASNQVPVYSNKVVSSRECYISKIVLGSASILTSLAIIGVGAGLVAVYPIELATLDIIYAFPPAVISIAWQKAEFIMLCVRRDRGIHPGAHVGMHLVICLACIALGTLLTAKVASNSSTSYWYGDTSDSSGYPLFLNLQAALAAFLWILMIIHFILFVRACVECNRRNTNKLRPLHTGQVAPKANP